MSYVGRKIYYTNMVMYADDTTVNCNINQHISVDEIHLELENISNWLSSNKLSLNVNKTKCMVFHMAQRKV